MTGAPIGLTAQSTLGEWLDDPVGGPLIRQAFGGGSDADHSMIDAGRGFPLETLVALSGGSLTTAMVESLVRAAAGEESLTPSAVHDTPSNDFIGIRSDLALQDIRIRDPFLVHDGAASTYWLYGTTDRNVWAGRAVGFDAYRSQDLVTWEGPIEAFRPPEDFWSESNFWAPEVHRYRDRWHMFATFTSPAGERGTQVLVADAPEGPFLPWSAGAVTPSRWLNLDGTLHVDDEGDPWIVYAHEWGQVHDGIIWAQRLSHDLREPAGRPVFLFNASEAPWTRPVPHRTTGEGMLSYVTDGPFLFRLASGHLIMLWSSFGEHGYAMGIAHSQSGTVVGPWSHEEHPIWAADGGHGMILRLHDGSLALTLHQPNVTPHERAIIRSLTEHDTTVALEASVD